MTVNNRGSPRTQGMIGVGSGSPKGSNSKTITTVYNKIRAGSNFWYIYDFNLTYILSLLIKLVKKRNIYLYYFIIFKLL